MSKNRAATKKAAPSKKGDPSGGGRSKAGSKPVLNLDNLEEHENLKNEYTDGPDEPAANVRVMNPNRNTDKPDIDKPSYS